MNVPGVEINLQYARLGIDETPYQIEASPLVDRVEVSQEQARVQIEDRSVEISIDMTEMRQDMGIYNFRDRMQRRVQESFEVALEAIGRYGEIGDRLMDFQNNDIADIAFEEMLDEDLQVEIGYLSPPEFTVEDPELEVGSDPAQFEMRTEMQNRLNRPEYSFEPGDINIYLRQEPDVEIISPGREVDVRA